MARFDEIELQPVVFETPVVESTPSGIIPASRFRRLLALITDLSLFVALALALSPLLPASTNWVAIAALAGFVTLVSFYYFVGCWLLWGRTIGGTIFDVRVIANGLNAMPFRSATQRWAGMMLSLALGGIGFALALLPSRLSLPDRVSSTCCVGSSD